MMEQRIKVAVPAPFSEPLDYLPPDADSPAIQPGSRVLVPLGRRQLVGIALSGSAAVAPDGLNCRPISQVLDAKPLLPPHVLQLCRWAAGYYHHPIGEVLAAALPTRLRQAKPLPVSKRKPSAAAPPREPPCPTTEQNAVLEGLAALPTGFHVSLIEGVTGSGKTEIYLRRVAAVIDRGGQALMLTPEIGLTPQLISRFRERFGDAVGVFHSGLTDKARAEQWLAAAEGRCKVMIGTRSAVFVPLPDLALILVDEEHDASFKQQDGFRYSARDVAIMRGQQARIPVILGSATPSLESLHNVRSARYQHFRLQARVGTRQLPKVNLLDLRGVKLTHGLSPVLLDATERHLNLGGQVLMFVNRRGYAPTLLCHDCGWAAICPHCDARLTLHRARGRLICHHCASEARLPSRCGQCSGTSLIPVGQGTERIEDALRERFPDHAIERIDSDRARRAGEMTRMLDDIHSGQTHILVGTQMLAKGHDFERLTLVGVVCADEALYSADFRASERLGQLLTQVAGRAGRGELAGEVLVQTHVPQHPVLQGWLREGYAGLTQTLLDERRVASLPPFAHLALLRADALNASAPLDFLRAASNLITATSVEKMGPIPAPMERKANRLRAQFMLRARNRASLQRLERSLLRSFARHQHDRQLRMLLHDRRN